MSPLLFDSVVRSLGRTMSPMRLSLRLAAAGWTAAACVWCVAVGAVGVLGQGLAALLALGVLGASALAALLSIRTDTKASMHDAIGRMPARCLRRGKSDSS